MTNHHGGSRISLDINDVFGMLPFMAALAEKIPLVVGMQTRVVTKIQYI
jgi:hypothetical protein